MGTFCVTGAASGIGAATAAQLASLGHEVIAVDLRDGDVTGDLGSPSERDRVVAEVTERCGGVLDGLVTSAGVAQESPAPTIASVNYFGSVEVAQGLRPCLERAEAGAVVMISSFMCVSTQGLTIADGDRFLGGDQASVSEYYASAADAFSAYPAGKLAIAMWVRSNAPDWARRGVRLNAVAPGVIETNMTRSLLEPAESRRAILDLFPIALDRVGTADEVASTVVFLATASSSYVIGQVLFVDGGAEAAIQPLGPLRGAGATATDG